MKHVILVVLALVVIIAANPVFFMNIAPLATDWIMTHLNVLITVTTVYTMGIYPIWLGLTAPQQPARNPGFSARRRARRSSI